tara:strand:- start:486 stop:923 length:438 start_codon:yes stop_codon:yes gene_type:complete
MTSWSKDGVMSSLIFLTFQIFLSLIYFKFQNDSLGAMVFLLNMGLALTFLYYAFIFHKNTKYYSRNQLSKNKRKMTGIILACLFFGLIFLFIEQDKSFTLNLSSKGLDNTEKDPFQDMSLEIVLLLFYGLTAQCILTFQNHKKDN